MAPRNSSVCATLLGDGRLWLSATAASFIAGAGAIILSLHAPPAGERKEKET